MAKIVIAGDEVVVTSAMKLEGHQDHREVSSQGARPEGRRGWQGAHLRCRHHSWCREYQRSWRILRSENRDDDKLACITLFLDGVTGDVKDWVADRLGAAIINLNKLEEKLPTVLEEIAAEKATVMSNITVAQ